MTTPVLAGTLPQLRAPGAASGDDRARSPVQCPAPATPATAGTGSDLLRALGSVPLSPPSHCQPVLECLGLPATTGAEHTAVFVLNAQPHAAIYLGGEGKLGGEGLDRVAGYWRAIGLVPPPDADHLGVLLMLYAELADAETTARNEATRQRLRHVRETLLTEHVWSWAPAYLALVSRLGAPALSDWARMTLSALHREARSLSSAALALALRTAPEPVRLPTEREQVLDALVSPVRSGILLTHDDLRRAAAVMALGYRAGERRYSLAAMLDQDPLLTLGWLAGHARRWAGLHAGQPPVPGDDPRHWWARRAAGTAGTLQRLHARAAAAERR
ncbi:MAG: molecular chaperone TorD family protein [Acidimicrobiales bacterium]